MQTIDELKRLQSQPLEIKVKMTEQRIKQWVHRYGEDGVYISFSGGKDSTVLLHIARRLYPNIKAMFVDVPTQYPELKTFAQNFENVDITKPKISFMEVCDKYGFPLISKEVSESVQGARKYLTSILKSEFALTDRQTDRQTDRPYHYWYERLTGTGAYSKQRSGRGAYIAQTENQLDVGQMVAMIINTEKSEELANILNDRMVNRKGGQNKRVADLLGWRTKNIEIPIKANIPKSDRSPFALTKWIFLLESPFEISNRCCDVMKKKPAHEYERDTKRMPIAAQMAEESRLRMQNWIQNGCNGFEMKRPISNPMAFWTENDVLEYIVTTGIEICSVYGNIVEDYGHDIDGQLSLADFGLTDKKCKYKCTGCKRTGCMLCGFGCHLEKDGEGRFQKLKESHPKMYALLDVVKNNGYTFRQAIEWANEKGNLHIPL